MMVTVMSSSLQLMVPERSPLRTRLIPIDPIALLKSGKSYDRDPARTSSLTVTKLLLAKLLRSERFCQELSFKLTI